MRNEAYFLNPEQVSENLRQLCRADKDSVATDFFTRNYYRQDGSMIWVNRLGVDHRADTLLAVMRRTVADMGFRESAFFVSQIAEDLERMRTLCFDEAANDANSVAARLEYLLTKAFLRYAVGQGRGFVNPRQLLNRLEPSKTDTLGHALAYQRLFDVAMKEQGKSYYAYALRQVSADSIASFLADVQPTDTLYLRLKALLPKATGSYRKRLLCNMERRRWRVDQHPKPGSRYVLVNVAAYHLWAVSPDTVIDMRVGCGAARTKTPLLTSYFTHMDINPDWNIPMSIIQKDIAHHAGDPSYFNRRGYYIAERKTGTRRDPSQLTSDDLLSGRYRVAQNGGPGNALGRIIFRFPNNFSVFLHDTSSRGFFSSDNRGVSHGCVRVQHPFSLAQFLMGDDADEWKLDRLRISMGMAPETERGKEYMEREDRPEQPRLVNAITVSPRVPLYITYYTLYPDPQGQLQTYPDVYGYDKAIEKSLKTFTD